MPKPILWTPPVSAAAAAALLHRCAELGQRLQHICTRFGTVRLASSLAAEDMVLTDMLAQLGLPVAVFTLNTGLLDAPTLALLPQIKARYGIDVAEWTPDSAAGTAFVADYGADAMYQNVGLRRRCCHIRKIEPLNRALQGADAWLTGQRRGQAASRGALVLEEYDAERGLAKFNPLFDWEEAEVWAYVHARNVPVDALYAQGYPSIGCAPCTRPVRAGEDIRAGRWWWESAAGKECGLHK